MVRKSYTSEQIIGNLREVEILLNQGACVGEACWKISVTEQTYYRWRKEYGGLRIEQAKRLKGAGARAHQTGILRESTDCLKRIDRDDRWV